MAKTKVNSKDDSIKKRRLNPRVNLAKEAKQIELFVIQKNSSEKIKASLINLSVSGIALNMAKSLKTDESVQIQILNGRKKIELEAKLRWQSSNASKRLKFKAGLCFIGMTSEEAAALANFVLILLKKSSKADLLKKIGEIYMMGYFADADLQLSTEYFMAKEEELENTIKRLNEIFEKGLPLIRDDEAAEQFKALFYRTNIKAS